MALAENRYCYMYCCPYDHQQSSYYSALTRYSTDSWHARPQSQVMAIQGTVRHIPMNFAQRIPVNVGATEV
jgi:hypothetical protein